MCLVLTLYLDGAGRCWGRHGGKEASLCWRSIHKNYFYLFFHKKTTEDKAGRQWWGRWGGGNKEEEPSRDLCRALDTALEGAGGSLCVAALTGTGFGEDNGLFRDVHH